MSLTDILLLISFLICDILGWKMRKLPFIFQYVTDLNCVHQKYKEAVPKTDRGDYKLTGKHVMMRQFWKQYNKQSDCSKATIC